MTLHQRCTPRGAEGSGERHDCVRPRVVRELPTRQLRTLNRPIVTPIARAALTALSLTAASFVPTVLRAQRGPAGRDSLAVVQRYAEWFFASEKDSLRAHSAARMQQRGSSPPTRGNRPGSSSPGASVPEASVPEASVPK